MLSCLILLPVQIKNAYIRIYIEIIMLQFTITAISTFPVPLKDSFAINSIKNASSD